MKPRHADILMVLVMVAIVVGSIFVGNLVYSYFTSDYRIVQRTDGAILVERAYFSGPWRFWYRTWEWSYRFTEGQHSWHDLHDVPSSFKTVDDARQFIAEWRERDRKYQVIDSK